jgi:hypothetical protein
LAAAEVDQLMALLLESDDKELINTRGLMMMTPETFPQLVEKNPMLSIHLLKFVPDSQFEAYLESLFEMEMSLNGFEVVVTFSLIFQISLTHTLFPRFLLLSLLIYKW